MGCIGALDRRGIGRINDANFSSNMLDVMRHGFDSNGLNYLDLKNAYEIL